MFVNLKGEPIDMKALMSKGAYQRHLDRQAGAVVRKPVAGRQAVCATMAHSIIDLLAAEPTPPRALFDEGQS